MKWGFYEKTELGVELRLSVSQSGVFSTSCFREIVFVVLFCFYDSFFNVSTIGVPDVNMLAKFLPSYLQHYFWCSALMQAV